MLKCQYVGYTHRSTARPRMLPTDKQTSRTEGDKGTQPGRRRESPAENPAGGGAKGYREGKHRLKIRGLFVDERCSRTILDFFSTTDVGGWPRSQSRKPQSKALEWELRERPKRCWGLEENCC